MKQFKTLVNFYGSIRKAAKALNMKVSIFITKYKKIDGLCRKCEAPHLLNITLCEKHRIEKNINNKIYKNRHLKKIKLKNKLYKEKNREIILKKNREYYLKVKKYRNEYTKNWWKNNKEKTKKYALTQDKAAKAARVKKRQAMKLQRTPKWLTKENLKEIELYYIEARELAWLNNGEILEVDHIIPLQGKNVCGLHVPWNLQLLPSNINRSKGNRI